MPDIQYMCVHVYMCVSFRVVVCVCVHVRVRVVCKRRGDSTTPQRLFFEVAVG